MLHINNSQNEYTTVEYKLNYYSPTDWRKAQLSRTSSLQLLVLLISINFISGSRSRTLIAIPDLDKCGIGVLATKKH